MLLTRDFKETIRARVERDPKFRKALLRECIESALGGEADTAEAIRDYVDRPDPDGASTRNSQAN
jgi:hypothetical protein